MTCRMAVVIKGVLGTTHVVVDIETQGLAYDVVRAPLRADFRAAKTPTRLGIRLKDPVLSASITLTITPGK